MSSSDSEIERERIPAPKTSVECWQLIAREERHLYKVKGSLAYHQQQFQLGLGQMSSLLGERLFRKRAGSEARLRVLRRSMEVFKAQKLAGPVQVLEETRMEQPRVDQGGQSTTVQVSLKEK
jgi:hypothetical protein